MVMFCLNLPEEEVNFDPSSLDGGVGPIKKTKGGKDDEIKSTEPIPSVSEFMWKMYFYIIIFSLGTFEMKIHTSQ